MQRALIAAACAFVLSGCALPTISTDLDPNMRRKAARTGTHFRGSDDLPRNWQDTNLKYADRVWLDDLVDRQRQLSESMGSPCSTGVRCSGHRQ